MKVKYVKLHDSQIEENFSMIPVTGTIFRFALDDQGRPSVQFGFTAPGTEISQVPNYQDQAGNIIPAVIAVASNHPQPFFLIHGEDRDALFEFLTNDEQVLEIDARPYITEIEERQAAAEAKVKAAQEQAGIVQPNPEIVTPGG